MGDHNAASDACIGGCLPDSCPGRTSRRLRAGTVGPSVPKCQTWRFGTMLVPDRFAAIPRWVEKALVIRVHCRPVAAKGAPPAGHETGRGWAVLFQFVSGVFFSSC